MPVYWMIWYCFCFLSGFKCTFSCIVKYSLYHNMDIGTESHCTLFSCTPSKSIGLFGVRVVLMLSVIRCYYYYFLDKILFHHDFIMIVMTIIGIFMANNYLLNYTLGFIYLSSLVLQMLNSLDVSVPGHSLWIVDWTCYLWTPLCHVYIPF